LGQGATLASLEPQDSAAARAEAEMGRRFELPLLARSAVVQRDARGLPPSAERRALVAAQAAAAGHDRGLSDLRGALPITNVPGLVTGSREDGTTLVTYLFFAPDASLDTQNATAQAYAERHARQALVGVAGVVPARVSQWEKIDAALPVVTLATVVLILLVVGLHFRAVGAPLITLAAAAIAYLVAVRLVGWLGERAGLSVPQEVEPVMIVLLLGVVTDYSVFFLSGTRRRLAEGDRRVRAAELAACANVPIVFTAGLIVALSTAALVVGHSKFFQAFGPGLALTALVAMLVAMTFVPAALGILGGAAFWPRRPDARDARDVGPRGWRVLLGALLTHPVVAAVVVVACVAGLGYAAWGLHDARLGLGLTRDLPQDAAAARAERAAAQGFAPGVLSPAVVLVEAPGVTRRTAQLVALERELARGPGVAATFGPAQLPARLVPGAVLSRDGGAARIALMLGVDPLGAQGVHDVKALQADLPALARRAGLGDARLAVAGDTALAAETIDGMLHDLARVGLAALLVNFVLLAIFLRALGPPVYLLAASVLALAASLGLTTIVFQDRLDYGELTYYVPFACAVLLVALGSDYNVFVTGQIWQRARDMPLRRAVAVTTPRVSRAITVAGLTLALSFALLAIVPLRSFREFAFTMAVGVLLETFVVRSLLVPSLISLFGSKRHREAQREREEHEARRGRPAQPTPV
jgi:putative drug exporter of the RND superfamily